MAFVIKEVEPPHKCHEELERDIDKTNYGIGTIAECSCGLQHVLRHSQKDGLYWETQPLTPRLRKIQE